MHNITFKKLFLGKRRISKTGYLNKDVHGVTITLLGKTASVINESDSFLCAEYLTKLFDRTFERDSENTKIALTFVLGSLIVEKECNRGIAESIDISVVVTIFLTVHQWSVVHYRRLIVYVKRMKNLLTKKNGLEMILYA